MAKPRAKHFGNIRVCYWQDPTFGPGVRLDEKGMGYKNTLELDVHPKALAKRLRKIALWLERL